MDDISLRTDEIISEDLELYGNMILRLSYSYMKNIHDSEDILQDVLIQLIKTKPDFKDEEHKKYKDAMNKITMDEDMKKRILSNLENINEKKEYQKNFDNSRINMMHGKFIRNIGMCAACCMVIICSIANQSLINILKIKDTNSQPLEISQDTALNESDNDTHSENKDSDSIEKVNEIENSTDKNTTDSKDGSLLSKKACENGKIQKSYSKSVENEINSSPQSGQSQDMTSNVQSNNSEMNSLNNNEISTVSKKSNNSNLKDESVNTKQSPIAAKAFSQVIDNTSDLNNLWNLENLKLHKCYLKVLRLKVQAVCSSNQ